MYSQMAWIAPRHYPWEAQPSVIDKTHNFLLDQVDGTAIVQIWSSIMILTTALITKSTIKLTEYATVNFSL